MIGPSLPNGSLGRARTADLVVNSHPLYQLSYQGSGRNHMQTRSLWSRTALLPEGKEG